MSRWMLVVLGALSGITLTPAAAMAQYPQYYCYPQPASPYAYPGPAGPMRQSPQVFVGSNYGPTPPPPVYYGPTYSSFYDPILNPPRYPQPGPYWYTQNYPFTSGYYSYYYTPGYFRY